ncbi:MAG: SIMPL domain-containing protein [Armatimonadota bacterium]
MKALLFSLFVSTLFLLPALAQREDRADEPVLVVSGNSEVRVAPDLAIVRLGVTRIASTAQQAQAEVNQAAQAILESVLRLQVPREAVQTSQLTIQPLYEQRQPRPGQEPQEPREPRIVAYQASNVVTIRLTRLETAGPVIDAALKAGANRLDGLSFGLQNDREARQRALTEAVREARQKARTMAEALDVRLVRVVEAIEGGYVRPMEFAAERAMMAAGDAGTPVSPGEVSVHANVTLRYRIQ